jgi:hypothetical protein
MMMEDKKQKGLMSCGWNQGSSELYRWIPPAKHLKQLRQLRKVNGPNFDGLFSPCFTTPTVMLSPEKRRSARSVQRLQETNGEQFLLNSPVIRAYTTEFVT